MFRSLYPKTTIPVLNYIKKRVILCTYNNLCIPKLGICNPTIIHKNVELHCSFSVVPGIVQHFQQCKTAGDYSCRGLIFETVHPGWKKGHVNEQSRQHKLQTNKN